jgi:SulP family sulfate permease
LRPEIQTALERMGVAQRLGERFIFPEQEKDYSATLAAIRAAYAAIEGNQSSHRTPTYYLV